MTGQLAAREAAWKGELNVFLLVPLLMTTLLNCPPCTTPGKHVQQGGVRYRAVQMPMLQDATTLTQMNKEMLSV
jgi:hypothetical protein